MTLPFRSSFAASGLLMLAGGPLHPDADKHGHTLAEEIAEMAADPLWVPGHALTTASTVLLAAGLWALHRRGGWSVRATRALRIAAVAVSLYVVETVAHLAAVVDADELAAGEFAPVAGSHVLLSAVLYPVSGVALAALGLALLREVPGRRRAVHLLAVVAGTVHALSVPVTMLLPDVQTSPTFAVAGVLLALWSVLTAAVGLPTPRPVAAAAPSAPEPALA
jgi:hypothetical protein